MRDQLLQLRNRPKVIVATPGRLMDFYQRGNVAFNSGGAHCLKYGMTSNHILGMRVVMADGTIEEVGSRGGEDPLVSPFA